MHHVALRLAAKSMETEARNVHLLGRRGRVQRVEPSPHAVMELRIHLRRSPSSEQFGETFVKEASDHTDDRKSIVDIMPIYDLRNSTSGQPVPADQAHPVLDIGMDGAAERGPVAGFDRLEGHVMLIDQLGRAEPAIDDAHERAELQP